jgi:hypothetical protein
MYHEAMTNTSPDTPLETGARVAYRPSGNPDSETVYYGTIVARPAVFPAKYELVLMDGSERAQRYKRVRLQVV